MGSFDKKNNLNLLLDNSAELATEEIRNLLNELSSSKRIDKADLIILTNTWKYSSNRNVEDTIKFLSDSKPIYVISTANFNDVTSLMYKIATKGIKLTLINISFPNPIKMLPVKSPNLVMKVSINPVDLNLSRLLSWL